jgi:hypothetical protein
LGYDFRLPVGAGIIFLVVIFLLQRFMVNKKPMELRMAFAGHNAILTVFSLVVCVGQTYEYIRACRVSPLTFTASYSLICIALMHVSAGKHVIFILPGNKH